MKKVLPTFVCFDHGRYRPPHPPKTVCNGCWAEYGRWRVYNDARRAVRSTGTAKGGGQSSKAKGRVAVQLVRSLLLSAYPALEPDDILVKATSMGGCDLHLSPAALKLFPFAIEVKCQESLQIWAALRQATENAGTRPPILFFKRARTDLYVALRARDFVGVSWPNVLQPLPEPVSPPEATPEPPPSNS